MSPLDGSCCNHQFACFSASGSPSKRMSRWPDASNREAIAVTACLEVCASLVLNPVQQILCLYSRHLPNNSDFAWPHLLVNDFKKLRGVHCRILSVRRSI